MQREFYTILQAQSLRGVWRWERNSVTQSRKEFTQPDHLPFESLPGCCSLERQLKFNFCILDCSADAIFLMLALSQAPSLSQPSHSSHQSRGIWAPWCCSTCAEQAQAAKTTANFLCTFFFSCLVFIFHTKPTWRWI